MLVEPKPLEPIAGMQAAAASERFVCFRAGLWLHRVLTKRFSFYPPLHLNNTPTSHKLMAGNMRSSTTRKASQARKGKTPL